MEASSSVRRRIGGNWPGGAFSGRRGPVVIAVLTALIAGLLIFLFVQQYKKSVNGTVTTSPVFVATRFIQKGTAASVIASEALLQRTLVASNQVRVGAIADPSVLQGEAAATDIYPGQQLTAADFTRASVTIASQLTGNERAIAVPVDVVHGLVGYVSPGSYVDVLVSGNGTVTTLQQNVLVLAGSAGGTGGGVGGSSGGATELVLKVTDKTALAMAYAADYGKIWVTLRPPAGATDSVGPNSSATNPKAK